MIYFDIIALCLLIAFGLGISLKVLHEIRKRLHDNRQPHEAE